MKSVPMTQRWQLDDKPFFGAVKTDIETEIDHLLGVSDAEVEKQIEDLLSEDIEEE